MEATAVVAQGALDRRQGGVLVKLRDVELAYAAGVFVGFSVALVVVGLVTAWCVP